MSKEMFNNISTIIVLTTSININCKETYTAMEIEITDKSYSDNINDVKTSPFRTCNAKSITIYHSNVNVHEQNDTENVKYIKKSFIKYFSEVLCKRTTPAALYHIDDRTFVKDKTEPSGPIANIDMLTMYKYSLVNGLTYVVSFIPSSKLQLELYKITNPSALFHNIFRRTGIYITPNQK